MERFVDYFGAGDIDGEDVPVLNLVHEAFAAIVEPVPFSRYQAVMHSRDLVDELALQEDLLDLV